MSKFNVGDKVKGNERADSYFVTDSNFVGYVTENLEGGKIRVSKDKTLQDNYVVNEECFDLDLMGTLKNGDILETNKKRRYVYFETDDERNLISLSGGHMRLKDYDDELKLGEDINNEFAIKKIYRYSYLGDLVKFIQGNCSLLESQLIWERAEDAKEMTVEEISKALGYEIKVVK